MKLRKGISVIWEIITAAILIGIIVFPVYYILLHRAANAIK
jgi:hypothetical protein